MNTDTTIYCKSCLREQHVSFAHCLGHGWPTCCGHTMSIKGDVPPTVIDAAVKGLFAPIREVLR